MSETPLNIQNASINTAGAFLSINEFHIFALGAQPYQGRIPIYRPGGHREAQESGWECAVREIKEETNLDIQSLTPSTTYLMLNGNIKNGEILPTKWQHKTNPSPAPILGIVYPQKQSRLLSLMYLAQTEGVPQPSSEVKGLIFLRQDELHNICQNPMTFEEYLSGGGKAILNHEFNQSLFLEPFLQVRLLSRILLANELETEE